MKKLITAVGMILVLGATGAASAGSRDAAPAKATPAATTKAQKPAAVVTPAKVVAKIAASVKKLIGCDAAGRPTVDPKRVSPAWDLTRKPGGASYCTTATAP